MYKPWILAVQRSTSGIVSRERALRDWLALIQQVRIHHTQSFVNKYYIHSQKKKTVLPT